MGNADAGIHSFTAEKSQLVICHPGEKLVIILTCVQENQKSVGKMKKMREKTGCSYTV